MTPELVTRLPPAAESSTETDSWWSRYLSGVTSSSFTDTGRDVLIQDCAYILDSGIYGVGDIDGENWPDDRVRRGVVMGAVQSGKTSSMFGLTALALDKGVEVVVILAGTSVALWRQTYERFVKQLDVVGLGEVGRERKRLLIPPPSLLSTDSDASLSQLYGVNQAQVRRAVAQRRPIVVVVMKNVHHIRALSNFFHQRLIPEFEAIGRSAHMLVLDDEADDGSILDERIENSRDPETQDLKQLPRAIVDLWARRPHDGETASKRLFVTYIGYTATPQANFLQSDHNPLAPTDFAISLRTPFDHGSIQPRSTVYQEPKGIGSFYIGGEAFYRRLPPEITCVATSGNALQDLAASMRSFFVAAAVRQWRSPDRLGYSRSRLEVFETYALAKDRFAEPQSMLIHPSVAISDHFSFAALAIAAVSGLDLTECERRVGGGSRSLPIDEIVNQLDESEGEWSRWLESFQESAEKVREAFGGFMASPVPSTLEWPEIRAIIVNDVLPNVRLAVINSDPSADSRPSFDPQEDPSGRWSSPQNLITIFVSGSVMSRGLTLEGLTTTLFYRSSDEPLADTQMQMQRWFGYRGKYLDLCRVFLSSEQLRLFRSFHDVDEALRRDIISEMNMSSHGAPTAEVLQGKDYLATGKLTAIRNWPLCPGAKPFIRITNSGEALDHNLGVLAGEFKTKSSRDVEVSGTVRGRILEEPLSLIEVASMLDRLRYENYCPSTESRIGERWKSLEAHVGLPHVDDESLLSPLYRPPGPRTGGLSDDGTFICPYSMAAYFRLWEACLSRHARGLFPTDNPNIPWSMVDLRTKTQQRPNFYIGIRYGSGDIVSDNVFSGVDFEPRSTIRSVTDGVLDATWGTQNPGPDAEGYRGDTFFDYHFHGNPGVLNTVPNTSWRPAGSPGLVLFYIIQRPSTGFHTVALGLVIPVGGPDQFAALTGPGE